MKADGCSKKDIALCMKLRKNMKFKQYKQKIRGSSGGSRAPSSTAAGRRPADAAEDTVTRSIFSEGDVQAADQASILEL